MTTEHTAHAHWHHGDDHHQQRQCETNRFGAMVTSSSWVSHPGCWVRRWDGGKRCSSILDRVKIISLLAFPTKVAEWGQRGRVEMDTLIKELLRQSKVLSKVLKETKHNFWGWDLRQAGAFSWNAFKMTVKRMKFKYPYESHEHLPAYIKVYVYPCTCTCKCTHM